MSGFRQGWKDRPIADNRGEPVSNQVRYLFLEERSQNDDRGSDACLAKRDSFVEGGDGKLPHALLSKRLSNLNRPMSIRIGLDDRHDFATGGQVALDAREIMGECREIDGGVGG